jgi:hypothetical protein
MMYLDFTNWTANVFMYPLVSCFRDELEALCDYLVHQQPIDVSSSNYNLMVIPKARVIADNFLTRWI